MTLWATTGLWRHRDFLNLWSAQIVSAFGSRITRTALPALAILTLGASDGDVALLGALAMAPAVLTGLVAARFIDRTPKRPLLIGDAFGAAFFIQGSAIRQTATPPEVLGRVNAAFVTMHAFALLTGSLVAVPLAATLGIVPAVLAGIALQLAGIAPVFAPRLLALSRIEDVAYDRPLI